MNGLPPGATNMGQNRPVAVQRYQGSFYISAGYAEERDGGIHGGGRREVADLLPADEPGAEPQERAR
jgi:hypothetical protein